MYSQQLNQRKIILEEQIATKKKLLNQLPTGLLRCYANGKSIRWYCKKENHPRKLISRVNRPNAVKLAYKTYLTAQLSDEENEYKAICAYLKLCDTDNLQQKRVLSQPGFYALLKDSIPLASHEITEWANAPYQHWDGHPGTLTHPTVFGYNMRSKSEELIGIMLTNHNIPFRYEDQLILSNGSVIHPDFTVMHPVTGKIYYWEHFGQLDNSNYCKSIGYKLYQYAAAGIFPGVNLIISFEDLTHPLTSETIERMIQQQLFNC